MAANTSKVAGKMYLHANCVRKRAAPQQLERAPLHWTCTLLAPKLMQYDTKKKNIRDIKRMERPTEPFAACYNGYSPMWEDLYYTAVC